MSGLRLTEIGHERTVHPTVHLIAMAREVADTRGLARLGEEALHVLEPTELLGGLRGEEPRVRRARVAELFL
jgi:hypothetical protein